MDDYYVGVDVQGSDDCPFCVIDDEGALVDYGWLPGGLSKGYSPTAASSRLSSRIDQFSAADHIYVGIDAPRCPLVKPRRHAFRNGRWQAMQTSAAGYGRHCEVVLKSLGVANPQWTPIKGSSPAWMQVGFSFYEELSSRKDTEVFEVFPSASYALLARQRAQSLRVSLPYSALERNRRDFIDAVVSGVTVRRFVRGRGYEVGGGDGMGTIILPTPLSAEERSSPVRDWPGRLS